MKDATDRHSRLAAILALACGAGDGVYAWRKEKDFHRQTNNTGA